MLSQVYYYPNLIHASHRLIHLARHLRHAPPHVRRPPTQRRQLISHNRAHVKQVIKQPITVLSCKVSNNTLNGRIILQRTVQYALGCFL